MSTEFHWVAVALVTIVSGSRLTRLLTFDVFPPTRWFRDAYAEFMDAHRLTRGWVILFFCPWCMSFWATLAVVLWGWLTDYQTAWWVINGALAASYLAAMLMVRDGDDSGDEPEDETDESSL